MTEKPGWLEGGGEWLDTHERMALGALISFYLAVVLAQATLKLVWADELITYYIARQPGIAGIWRALQAGTDPNPPLMHVLVQWSTAALGGNALGMRAPAMLCVLLAIMAMWWMLRRWVRPVYALVGCLAFMATRAFDYAYDARSYAPMMGFAMASLALWMAAGDLVGWRRFWALAGMAAALAAGISSNYYCVLAFFPIAVGELLGWRWRPGVWVAMAVASLPLIAYMPLIRHNIAQFGPHAWNRPRVSMIGMSYLELVEGIFWPVLGLGIWAVWRERNNPMVDAVKQRRTWGTPEMAAVGVLLVYPLLGFAIAIGGAGMISPRCVAPVCCGVGLAAGVLGSRVFDGVKRAGMALVVLLVVWVVVREGVCAGLLWEQRKAFFALRDEVADTSAAQILVADSSFALPLYFYSAEKVRRKMVFPIDFEAIYYWEKDDSGEENLWAGRNGVFPFPIVRFAAVDVDPGGLVVIARRDGWLAKLVHDRGIRLEDDGEQQATDYAAWKRLGGVFTPMAHQETRIMIGIGPRR
jgi:hypothetical protein